MIAYNDPPDGLPLRPLDPQRSQALEEPAQKLPCKTSAIQDGSDDAGKPSAPVDLVERLVEVVRRAERECPSWDWKVQTEASVRDILSELAAMGAEALQSDEMVEDLALDILCNQASDDEDAALKIAQAVLRQCHDLIAPILAAKDAERERLQSENATLTDLAQKLGTLSAMLNTLGLPDEPKALAREIMGRSKDTEALRAELARLKAEKPA